MALLLPHHLMSQILCLGTSYFCFETQLICHLLWEAFPDTTLPSPVWPGFFFFFKYSYTSYKVIFLYLFPSIVIICWHAHLFQKLQTSVTSSHPFPCLHSIAVGQLPVILQLCCKWAPKFTNVSSSSWLSLSVKNYKLHTFQWIE